MIGSKFWFAPHRNADGKYRVLDESKQVEHVFIPLYPGPNTVTEEVYNWLKSHPGLEKYPQILILKA
jgi:hypothetical protein